VPGLGARLGRGGATTFLQNLAESDCIVIMGANMAENHPVGFRFVVQARERGATVIHIDPRFTRTSALSDIHLPIRAGSDIAFLGGLINHVLTQEAFNREYVAHFTNGTDLVDDAFLDTEDLAGRFSGFDDQTSTYDPVTWTTRPTAASARDQALADPRSVLSHLRRHFSRYTPEMVSRICGISADQFIKVAEAITRNSTPDRTTAFAYSVAWTQHTTGTQMIASCAILQLLLGNIGRPGGGIMALRGHATIQGSTDIPTLFNLLPGYLPMPCTEKPHDSLADYLANISTPDSWWTNAPAYMVSLLRAFYGDAAHPESAFGYDLLPRITGDLSAQQMAVMMDEGVIEGLFCMGQNPAVGGQNAKLQRRGLAALKWLVVRDPFEIESASFWEDGPEVTGGDLLPEDIGTEVFLLPAALTAEKDGSYTNTQRLVQWHDRAVDPPGDARTEAWFTHQLWKRLRERISVDNAPAATQFHSLAWPYTENADGEPELDEIVAEINGYDVATRRPVSGFTELRSDGTTACGCWIYSGIRPADGRNRSKDRDPAGRAAPNWGFAWPANRRILYNRASARPDGSPWSAGKAWVWWDAARGTWTGEDVPDFPASKAPDYRPVPGEIGIAAQAGDAPFIMLPGGTAKLFATTLADGPLPTHYEPWESPVANAIHPDQPRNPAARAVESVRNPFQPSEEAAFPHVLTTYRLTEHHTAGGMSRYVPWLAELQPAGFAEIDPVLASRLGVITGDGITITTVRGAVTMSALVTERLQPIQVDGRAVHHVGIPWHYGYGGIAQGAIANDLTPLVEDPNSLIHEAKALTCDVRKAEPIGRDTP